MKRNVAFMFSLATFWGGAIYGSYYPLVGQLRDIGYAVNHGGSIIINAYVCVDKRDDYFINLSIQRPSVITGNTFSGDCKRP